jgi:antitoxin component YwqK of YwqJK toxin-antitoxin module
MKLNQVLLLVGLAGLGVVGATQTMRSVSPEAATTYWANGKMQTRTEQRDGVPEGLAERWHADGSKQAEGHLRGGRMEGEWQFWLPDGTPDLERSGTYRDGKRMIAESTESD